MPARTTRVHLSAKALLVALFLPAAAAAEAPRWHPVTPPGGPLVALAEAPSAPQILYAAARTGRIYRSVDGGASWQPRALAALDIRALHVDSRDPETAYAETPAVLLRTENGGRTWTGIRIGTSLAVDRAHPGVVFAATDDEGLLRSSDRGATWTRLGFAGVPVAAVAIDPQTGSTLFAITGFRELGGSFIVWKSTDGGATWADTGLAVTPEFFDFGAPRLVLDPAHPGTLYAAFVKNSQLDPVFRSSDGGATWTELTAALGLHDLVAGANGDLFGAAFAGTSRSRDGGATWDPPLPLSYPPPSKPVDLIARLAASAVPGRVLAAGTTGFWATGDSGAAWTSSNQGIAAQGALSVAVTPEGPPTVLATAGLSVFHSTDQGTSWQRLYSDVAAWQPLSLEAFAPHHPRTVYATGFDGQASFLVESTNGGRTWSQLPVPYRCGGDSVCDVGMSVAAVDPRDPDTLFVSGYYFYHFGGMGDFLLRSDDGFATWTSLTPLHRLGSLIVDTEDAATLYGITCTGLHRSQDGGKTWQRTGRGLPKALCNQGWGRPLLVRDPQEPRTFYAGTSAHGVFVSFDGGATFRPMSRGLETGAIVTLLIDPVDPSKLYAGALTKGVFRWNADRQKWTPLNRGLPQQTFLGVLALDPQHPSVLYAAHPLQGIFRLDLEDTEP